MDRIDDELELEVSDLRTGRAVETPLTRQPAAGAGVRHAAQEPQGGDAELTLEPLITHQGGNAPGWLASRRTRGFAVSGVALLVCAAILLTVPGAGESLRQALAGPTPTPTAMLALGADGFYFVNTVPWGSLAADGSPLYQPAWGTPTTLPRGRHTLEYRADPFPSLRCQVTVPASPGDTCPLTTQYGFGPDMGAARVIDLGLTPGKLPPAQRAALEHTVAAALQSDARSTPVAPGDHYLGADGSPAVATATLRATRTLALNTDPARNPMFGPGGQCVSLCDDFGGGGGPGDVWLIQAHVVARWQFTAPDGSVIRPANGGEQDATIEVEVGRANGLWSANQQPSRGYDPLCDGAFNAAFRQSNPLPDVGSTSGMFAAAPDGISGCVQVFVPASDGAGGPPPGPYATPTPLPADAAIFISRFGVVLAGNDAAHAAQPQLPLASPRERTLAQQWLPSQSWSASWQGAA